MGNNDLIWIGLLAAGVVAWYIYAGSKEGSKNILNIGGDFWQSLGLQLPQGYRQAVANSSYGYGYY